MNGKYNTVLFKYMPLTPEDTDSDLNEIQKQKDRIKQIFIDHKVYFPKPSKLNDIFECKPRLEPPKSQKKGRIPGT